jgi:3-hydroxybutyryl-CoA dehydrogenase
VSLVPTDGRTATALAIGSGRPTVVIDLLADDARRVAIAGSASCSPTDVAGAVGLLQGAGLAVSVVEDVPGLILARTVAMLANEAADVAGRGVAAAEDVDRAMELGANYPRGPLTWGDEVGADRLVRLLDTLAAHYGDGRYRPCPTLRRAALTGTALRRS